MAKKYAFIRVWSTTKKSLDQRVKKMNDDLKMMGVKKTIPKIRVIDTISKKLFYISDSDLIKLAKNRKNKRC